MGRSALAALLALLALLLAFEMGRRIAHGELLVLPSGQREIFWLNLFWRSSTSVPAIWVTFAGLLWLLVFQASYLLTRRIGVLVAGGVLLSGLASPQMASGILLELGGFSVRFATAYWVLSVLLVLLFATDRPAVWPGKRLPGEWAMWGFILAGLVSLLWGLVRGTSGFVFFASIIELSAAFFLTAWWISSKRALRNYIILAVAVALVRGGQSYYLLATGGGAVDASGWGRNAVHIPAYAVLLGPLFVVWMLGGAARPPRWREWRPFAGVITAVGAVIIPVVFSIQRAHWVGLAGGALALAPLAWVLGTRRTMRLVLLVALVAVPLLVPVFTIGGRGSYASQVGMRFGETLDELGAGSGRLRRQDLDNAIGALRGNPLLGDGLGAWYHYTSDPGDPEHGYRFRNQSFHLSLAWVAANMGALGLTAIGLVFASVSLALLRTFRATRDQAARVALIAMGACVAAMAAYGTVDWWLPHSWRTPMIGVVLGAAAGTAALYLPRRAEGEGRA